jgi:hypothetical protein
MPALTLVDHTRRFAPPQGVLEAIAAALTIQIERDFAPVWGHVPSPVTVAGRGQPIHIFDSSRSAEDDYGFTTVDTHARPYAHVFAKASFDHQCDWLTGIDSIATSISHEALEMLADPSVNTFHYNAKRLMWGHDLCDPVQECTYGIRACGRLVPVSNFVLPTYFNPYGAHRPFDFRDNLRAPFTIFKGGYATVERAQTSHSRERNRIDVRFDPAVPRWRRDQKRHGWGRTTWRILLANP